MKTYYAILENSEKETIEIIIVLNSLGLPLVKSLDWVIFDLIALGPLVEVDKIEKLKSSSKNIKSINGSNFLELMQKIQTDWAVCFGFKDVVTPNFEETPISNPENIFCFQNKDAEIEIRSFDGTKVFVFTPNKKIIEQINKNLKKFVIKTGEVESC